MNWQTQFERSDGLETPTYLESLEFIEKICAKNRLARIQTFGKSPQGRDMKCVILGKALTPQLARKRKKAVVMIQNAIHGGEMEGKDAWMLLLREILITRDLQYLLNNLVIVMIPVFNVDGHERRGQTNRPNQIGPLEQGWRTTAQNLDLNRDYMKADAPEMKALLQLYHYWLPDFCIDNHCTDGADFQYRILYGLSTHQHLHPVLSDWIRRRFLPFLLENMESRGIPIAPYNEGNDLRKGIINAPSKPRYSTGYSAIQNRVSLLVEAHSLKPYADRVYSTKALNQTVMQYLNANSEELIQRNRIADEDTIHEYCVGKSRFPITVELKQEAETVHFRGIRSYEEESLITGSKVLHYTGEPEDLELPFFSAGEVLESLDVPAAYHIPVEYADIAQHLQLHGIEVHMAGWDCVVPAERYRFHDVTFANAPYESRFQVLHFRTESFQERITIRKSSFLVQTAQRALRAIIHLLEPLGPDSLLRWGFFPSIFERKEYAEPYIMEPIARKMLANDPVLAAEFAKRLEDEAFRNDPARRLDFFYQRSIYFDQAENVYPISRLRELPNV